MSERLLGLARKAYAAYGEATGGKNYQGLPMPAFEDLPDGITYAWCAAVNAVLTPDPVSRETSEGA